MKYKIGEFSKICKVTVKTLRYYEEEGLIEPSSVDKWTGYRYYDTSQLESMCRILYLRELGFSLVQIKGLLVGENASHIIKSRYEFAKSERNKLERQLAVLGKLDENLKGELFMEEITIKSLPRVIVASHRTVIENYEELNRIFPEVMYPAMQKSGCVCREPEYCFNIYHDGEYRESNIDVETCQAVTEMKKDTDQIVFKVIEEVPVAVCVMHKGPYSALGSSYAKAFSYIEKHGFKNTDFPRECYIDGIWNKDDPAEWLTEIQVPVEKK